MVENLRLAFRISILSVVAVEIQIFPVLAAT